MKLWQDFSFPEKFFQRAFWSNKKPCSNILVLKCPEDYCLMKKKNSSISWIKIPLKLNCNVSLISLSFDIFAFKIESSPLPESLWISFATVVFPTPFSPSRKKWFSCFAIFGRSFLSFLMNLLIPINSTSRFIVVPFLSMRIVVLVCFWKIVSKGGYQFRLSK